MSYTFVGPVVVDVVPLQITFPPSLLMQQLAYGQTVWRDAGGHWHQKYAPTDSDLAGADRVYGGGRVWTLTDAQATELLVGGYADYIQPLPVGPIVGTAIVGVAQVG